MLDMTQSDLAKVIGLTFQQLQKYEKGTNRITASTLQKLAAGMKVPITYFFEDAPCENADRNETEMAWTRFVATPDGLALFRAFRLIESKSLRRAVVNLVEGMGKEPTIISPEGRQCDRTETAASRLRSRSNLDAFTMAPDARRSVAEAHQISDGWANCLIAIHEDW